MWVRPRGFILKSLICQEKFPKKVPHSVYEHYTKIFAWPGSTHAIYFQREKESSGSRLRQGHQLTTAERVCACLWLAGNLPVSGRGAAAGSRHPAAGVQLTHTGHLRDGALMQEPPLNCLRPTCDWRVTCPSAEISTIICICLCIYMPLISHFHGATFLSPLQAFQFRMQKMWLIQLPLPSPTWLHPSEVFSPARSDMGHTTGRQREAYCKVHFCLGTVLLEGVFPCYSCADSHPSGDLIGSILCIVVVKNLERDLPSGSANKPLSWLIHWAVT